MEDVRDRPSFSLQQAQQLARQYYHVDAIAKELPSERDQNFQLETAAGDSYVLKLANSSADSACLAAQNEAMSFIRKCLGTNVCPEVLPAMSGEFIEHVEAENRNYCLRLLTYVPGVPQAKFEFCDEALEANIGRFVGKLCSCLAEFQHPALHRELHWDLKSADTVIRNHVQYISDQAKLALVQRCLVQYAATFPQWRSQLRESVIHNDCNDYNLMIREQPRHAGESTIGVIDFGDMVFTHTVNELAILLAYSLLNSNGDTSPESKSTDPLATASTITRAFHGQMPLENAEFAVLFDLVKMRLCTSVCLSAHQCALQPENEYLSVSEGPAWQLLEQLDSIPPAEAEHRLREACGESQSLRQENVDFEELNSRRQKTFSGVLSLSYDTPLHILKGHAQYLYAQDGRAYLDLVNNVCHVGHCHPKVVEALANQARQLNTNTRYLHGNIVEYAERLLATFPEPLDTCFFVNSGSEANDLALRLARAATGNRDTIVLEGAYHGNLATLVDVSPYKFDGPGGQGAPSHVHQVPMPDGFRGRYRWEDPQIAERYSEHVRDAIENSEGVGAFISESLLGCGGQIVLPTGYLTLAYSHVREAGGICIADEVQVGFGRVGCSFWGFETQSVVPDIVTMGKPIGNGHPIGAVVTTRKIAQTFDNGMEYFNTFGGNPVSAAVGLAVLDVIENEHLQFHARELGKEIKDKLLELAERHNSIGEVRGLGLFLGIELVDPLSGKPDSTLAKRLVEFARENQILLSVDGPARNVIKIKPPLVIDSSDAGMLVAILECGLAIFGCSSQ